MRRLRLVFVLLATLAGFGAPRADHVEEHRRVLELQKEFHARLGEDDRQGALRSLDAMAGVDINHPLIGVMAAYFHRASEDWEAAQAWMHDRGLSGSTLLFGLARIEYFKKDYVRAEAVGREALEGYVESRHVAGEAFTRTFVGAVVGLDTNRADEAVEILSTAGPLFVQLEDPLGHARVISSLGSVELRRGNLDKALVQYQRAREMREPTGNKLELAVSWTTIGRTLYRLGRGREALDGYEKALDLRREIGDDQGQHELLVRMARLNGALHDLDGELRCRTEALEVAQSLDNARILALSRYELARVKLRRGDPDRAIDLLVPVVGAGDVLDPSRLSRAYCVLGQARTQAGQFDAAAEALQSARQLADRIENGNWRRWAQAEALAARAALSYWEGELASALLEMEEVVRLWRLEPPVEREESEALNDLGVIHWRLGQPEIARRYVEESLRLAQEIDDPIMLATAHNDLGLLLSEIGRHEEALAHLEVAIEIRKTRNDRKYLGLARYNKAGTLGALGRREAAGHTLELALRDFREIEDPQNEAHALNRSAGFLVEGGKLDEAIALYSETVETCLQDGFQWPLYEALAGRSVAHEKAGSIVAAVNDLEHALEVIESLRTRLETSELKMQFLEDKMVLYERAVSLETRREPKKAARAFRLVEQARARSLLDSLTESRVTSRVGPSADLARRRSQAIAEVAAAARALATAQDEEARKPAREQLNAFEERLRSLEVEIRRKAPRYSDIVYPQPISLQDTQNHVVGEDETLLRYFIGHEHALLWIVDRDQIRFHTLPAPDEIAELVERFRQRAGRATVRLGGRTAGAAEAEALAEALHVAGLPAGRRLLIVPDGPLHHLPFDALRGNGRYLVEDHEILVVPSATTLKLMRDEPTTVSAGGFLGIGAPAVSTDATRFPALPASGQALDRIAALFPEDERVVLKGDRATKEELQARRLNRFRYLHFATHGWLDVERPRYFGLQLGSDFLYLDEVFSLRLAAELVVLAACSSGLGEMLQGEGIVGMTRGFLYAGARSLLVSLWDVEDRASAEFMEAFYGELTAGTSIPEALRATKLSFIRSDRAARRQPHQWAPFVLVGDAAQGATTSKNNSSSALSASDP